MAEKTIAELKVVCPQMEPYRNLAGNVKLCKHRDSKDLCKLPGRFECIVKSYLDRLNAEDHTSYSQSSTFLSCPLKYYFSYIAKVPLEKKPSWAWLGNTFHECAANIDMGQKWEVPTIPDNSFATEAERISLQIVLLWYDENKHLFEPAVQCEAKIEFRTPKNRLVIGSIDAISQASSAAPKILRERKYSGADYSELVERRQVSMYFAGVPDAAEVHIENFSKPRLKLNKGETLADFAGRIRALVTKKSKEGSMVEISRYHRGSFPIESEIAAIDQIMDLRDQCLRTGVWPGNYSPFNCPMCNYKDHCVKCTV